MGETRWRGRFFLIAFVVVIIALGAAAFALKFVFTPERIRAEVVRAVENETGLSIQLGDAQLSLLPLAIDLANVVVAGAAAGDPPLLTLDAARVRVALAALLRGKIVVESLRFEKPVIALRREGTGIVLPGKLGATGTAAASGASRAPAGATPPTTIRRLEIVEGSLRLLGPPPEGDLELQGIELGARLDISDGGNRLQFAGDLALQNLSLDALLPYRETLDALSPRLAFDIDSDGAAGTLVMNAVRLIAGPLDLVGRGRIDGLPAAPRIEFVLDPSRLELSNLLPLLPPAMIPEGRRPRASGPVQVAAHLSGPLGNAATPPSFTIDITFEGAELGMEGFPLSIADLKGNVTATDTALTLREMTASVGEGTIRVDGTITGPPDSGRVDLGVVAAMDLGLIEKTGFLEPGTTLAGRLDADVHVLGQTGSAAAPELRGSMKLANGRFTATTLPVPVENLQADLAFEGTSANLRAIAGSIGRSAFDGSGRVTGLLGEPHVVLQGHCAQLDLIELMPMPDSTLRVGASGGTSSAAASLPPLVPELPPLRADLKLVVDSLIAPDAQFAGTTLDARLESGVAQLTAKVARAHFGEGLDLFDLTGEGVMKSGRLDGSFRSPRADAFKVPMQAISGGIAVADRRVDVTNVRAGLFTGSVEGSAIVDMTDPFSPSFEIDSRAKDIQANDFLSALTPARNVMHGSLDLASKFSGKGLDPKAIAQSLVANGRMDARGGRLENASYTQAIWKALKLDEREAISFREMAAPFSIRGGQLITENLVVASSDATWRASGALGFDGLLDYKVELELSDALANDFRKRAGRDLANLLVGSSGKITLDLAVKGPAAQPSVSLDTAKLAQRAAANVTDQAKRGLDSVKDQLADRLGLKPAAPADSAAASGADSAKVAQPPKLEDALRGLLGGKRK